MYLRALFLHDVDVLLQSAVVLRMYFTPTHMPWCVTQKSLEIYHRIVCVTLKWVATVRLYFIFFNTLIVFVIIPSRYSAWLQLGEEYIYKNLREDSPRRETHSNGGNSYMAPPPTYISNNHHQHLAQQQQQHQQQQQSNSQQQQQPQRDKYTNSMSNCGQQPQQQHSTGLRNSKKRYSCGRDGSHDGAATISYMRPRKDSTRSTQSCQFDAEQLTQAIASKTMHVKSNRRKNSIGCLNSLSSSPGSPGCYYCVG